MASPRSLRSNAWSNDMGMGPGDHLTGFFSWLLALLQASPCFLGVEATAAEVHPRAELTQPILGIWAAQQREHGSRICGR